MRIQNSKIPILKKQVFSSSASGRKPVQSIPSESFGAIASDLKEKCLKVVRQEVSSEGTIHQISERPVMRNYGTPYPSFLMDGSPCLTLCEPNLAGYNLSNTLLTGFNFLYGNFVGANLSGANLSRVNLSNSNLTGANLKKSTTDKANLTRVNLSSADLSEVNLKGTVLNKANLRKANLTDADLSDAELVEANLNGANLERANASDANLRNANLRNANLHQTNFTNTSLVGVDLKEVDLREAELKNANFATADLRGTKFPEIIEHNSFSFPVIPSLESINRFLKVLDLISPEQGQKATIRVPQPYIPDNPLVTKSGEPVEPIPESTHNHYLSISRSKGGCTIEYHDDETQLEKMEGTKVICKFQINSEGKIIPISDQSFIPPAVMGALSINQNDGIGLLSGSNFQAIKQDLKYFFSSQTLPFLSSDGSPSKALERTLIIKDQNGIVISRQSPFRDGLTPEQNDAFHLLLTGETFAENQIPTAETALTRDTKPNSYEFLPIAADLDTKQIKAIPQTFNPSSPNEIKEPINNLSGMNLAEADLSGADLSGTNLSSTNLEGASLSRANLSEANLNNANLRGADLFMADLSNANLRGATLQFSDLAEANLGGADLQGANLKGADLSNSSLKKANLNGADLSPATERSGEIYNNTSLQNANLSEANLSGTDLRGVNFQGANLSRANLSNSYFPFLVETVGRNTRTVYTDFLGANLSEADLSGADGRGSNLSRANLKDTNFTGTHLEPFVLNQTLERTLGNIEINTALKRRKNGELTMPTHIMHTDLTKANLKGADLSEANLTGTQLPISNPFTNLLKKFTNILERNEKTVKPNSDDAKAKMIEESESTTNLAEAEPTLPTDISSTDQNSQKDRPETDPEQGDTGTPVNKPKFPNQPDSGGETKVVEKKIAQPSTEVAENTNNSADSVTDSNSKVSNSTTSKKVNWESLKQNSNRTMSGAGEIAVVTETENQSFNRMDSRVFTGEQKVVAIPVEEDYQQELEITGESSRSLSERQVETVSV